MTTITMMNIANICNKIIEFSFYSLFFFVPLAFASDTFELFEFNKMWLTYGLTIIIAASWIAKMILQRRILLCRTPLDIPIALFLTSQIISTIFSWDPHVSIWGYYSRFNGGLLSMISYVFLYYAFVSNFRNEQARGDASGGVQRSASSFAAKARLEGAPLDERAAGPRATSAITVVKRSLFVSLLSGFVVALWGLPSHFGYDPTCLIFRGTLDVSCWTADFQPMVRIFSTLGQPSWLAAYLAILIPIAIAFSCVVILKSKGLKDLKQSSKKNEILRSAQNDKLISNFGFWIFLLLSALFYLDLLYTSSKSGFIAIWISLAFFFVLYIWFQRKQVTNHVSNILKYWYLLVVFVVLVFITFFVGQPFSQLEKFTFEGIKKNITSTKTTIESRSEETPNEQKFAGELGGTDSGEIRKIVWQGAFDIWRSHPIFGTGVETFAFAYYKFRPVEHNLTSEWNFLYNKAHNEYLNYLATTGIVGLGAYLSMIILFLLLCIKYYVSSIKEKKHNTHYILLNTGLLASYISILITNFFGFSVVITNIYLFLIPAFVFVLTGMIESEKKHESKSNHITPWQWTFIALVVITSFYMLTTLLRFWNADKAYGLGSNLDKAGEYQQAYSVLLEAVGKRPSEPVFRDELAINNAVLASALLSQEQTQVSTETASLADQLAQDAIKLNDMITLEHPSNIIFWKSRVRIFYALSQADPSYLGGALEAVKKAQTLAPTDANISYNLGVLYGQNNEIEKGISALENTIKLKTDYRDAHYALALFYHDQAIDDNGNVVDRERLNKAITKLQFILENLGEDDTVAQETLEQWKKL